MCIAAAVVFALLVWVLVSRLRTETETRTDAVVFCVGCGYDLAGLPSGAPCPECGRSNPSHRTVFVRRVRISDEAKAAGDALAAVLATGVLVPVLHPVLWDGMLADICRLSREPMAYILLCEGTLASTMAALAITGVVLAITLLRRRVRVSQLGRSVAWGFAIGNLAGLVVAWFDWRGWHASAERHVFVCSLAGAALGWAVWWATTTVHRRRSGRSA